MKKLSLLVVAMCLLVSATVGQSVWNGTNTTWTKGDGTAANPYEIENAAQLAHLAVYVNSGTDANAQKIVGINKHWKLTADINLNNLQWTPIGYYVSNSDNYSFGGHFDGDGHTIANLLISSSMGWMYAGLFGLMDAGSVKNIGITGISSIAAADADAAYTYSYAGAIVGRCNSITITNCWSAAAVSSSCSYFVSDPGSSSGGIVGYANSSVIINNCYNTGSVSSSSGSSGGIVGYANSSVTVNNCYNTGSVSSGSSGGGIVGSYEGNVTVNNCYNTGSVSSSHSGGIVGYRSNNGSITVNNCYNIGSVSSSSPYSGYLGGIAGGSSNGTVNNSYYLSGSCAYAGKGIVQSGAFMQTQGFVDMLNGGSCPNGVYALDTSLSNNGYPVFGFQMYVLPASNITQTQATLNCLFKAGSVSITTLQLICNSQTISLTPQDTLSYTVTGLSPNTFYAYTFRAISSCGDMYEVSGNFATFLSFKQSGNAFLIETQADLILLANLVNGGNPFRSQEFILANDITLPNTPNNILSIGNKEADHPFSGIFNGNSNRIFNAYIDHPNTPYQGLFGYTKDAHIKDLGLVNITASGRDYTGGMVGYADNTRLDYSYISGGSLFALNYCGGLVGYQTAGTNSIITACYNTSTVTGNYNVGGLLGYSDQGTVRNSYVAGLVAGSGNSVGAIIGGAYKVLSYNCWFNDSVTGQTVAIGDHQKSNEGEISPNEMRMQSFVNTLNQGLVTPMWKMDYNNPPINNGFPILMWQTGENSMAIATLSSLTVSEGVLSPSFNRDTYNYTVNVAESVTSVTLNATASVSGASVSGTGLKQLSVGSNPFTVTVTSADGKAQKNYTVTVNRGEGVGIVETDNYPSLRVYPNPAGNQLTVECRDGARPVPTVEIYSVVGQKLMQLPCRDVINHVSTIDVSGLASGMYFLKVGNQVTKFIKE